MENTKVSNSKILKRITELKSEISELKNLMIALMKDKTAAVEIKNISDLIESMQEKNNECYLLQNELIARNYEAELEYNGDMYKPIQLLKLKEKLMQEKEIYGLFTEANIIPDNSEDLLKLSLQKFQKYQAVQKELSSIYEILEKYNKEPK